MVECNEHRGETEAMASCPRCLILYWESKHAALRARVEALEAFVQDLADESCLDRGSHRNQEACGETNLRLIDYCGPCRARALLEQKP